MRTPNGVPVLGFAAFSGTGKTTLLARLIPRLRDEGLRIGLIKHAHHRFDVDTPGKDSYELRKAGAERVLLASRRRTALMVERDSEGEPKLADLIRGFPDDDIDLVMVEGFKHESFSKIELHRPSRGLPLLATDDPSILAVACDAPLATPLANGVARLDLNDIEQLTRFVLDFVHRRAARSRTR